MTKKSNGTKEPENTEYPEPNLDGFLVLSTGEERIYAHAVQGAIFTGVLSRVDEIEDENGMRRVYGIIVDRPVLVVKSKASKEPFQVEAGSLVYVGERYQLKDLAKIMESPQEAYVYIKFIKQRDLGDKRTIWDVMCAVRPTGKRKLLNPGTGGDQQKMLKEVAQKLLDEGKSDIPF